MSDNGYILGFQGLRGYAIILIFLSHFNFAQNVKGVNVTGWWGALGVELFIILSGYLLMAKHANKGVQCKKFLLHKIQKFYPLHLVTLIMAMPFAIKALLAIDLQAWFALLLNGLLLQAWIPNDEIYFSFNSVAWYLSLTIFFSFVSPWVIKFWNKLSYKKAIITIVFLISVEFVWCLCFENCSIAHWLIYIFPVIRSIDYLLGGGIWKLVQCQKIERISTNYSIIGIFLLILIIMSISMTQNSEWFSVWVWVIPSLLLMYTIVFGVRSEIIKYIFENPIAVGIGNISFEIFLIHQLVIKYMDFINSHFLLN